jgi:N-methylhydantoinase A/oxoprolinase/acetone carboxylase beta subunit
LMATRYGLGIDAGGTFTDAVLLDLATGRLEAAQKSPTTRPDPTRGIHRALARIDNTLLSQVGLVSLATTFATNAIVENRGAEAGLILIGYDDKPPEMPKTTRIFMVGGGHTVAGEERRPLDVRSLEAGLDAFLEGLDAVAVAGFFSVRNPEHEIQVARIIQGRFDLPVVCGHDLSMRLDAWRRATTAWWNARLIPLISNLIAASKKVLSETGIIAPLMMVRGDGTLMSAKTALDRPVETLLSGPAASILGAGHLSGLTDALIIDMGGTTADMAVLEGGKVAVDPQGAAVGKWKTHVKAARVRTIGLGGDSVIRLDADQRLVVGPRRVVPLCVAAQRIPEIPAKLQNIQTASLDGAFAEVNPCSFYIRADERPSGERRELPGYFDSGPVSEYLLFREAGRWRSLWDLERFEQQGLVYQSALTPTDLLVAQGVYQLGNSEAAKMGVRVFSEYLHLDSSRFMEAVSSEIARVLCLEAAAFTSDLSEEVLRELGAGSDHDRAAGSGVGLDVRLSLTAPVIGGGAPAGAWLPAAFDRLHTECVLPDGYEVSAAVGAIVGMVDITLLAEIRPDEAGRFVLYSDAGKESFPTRQDALERARERLEQSARDRLLQDYVVDPMLEFSVEDRMVRSGHGEDLYLETIACLRATGRPSVGSRHRMGKTAH